MILEAGGLPPTTPGPPEYTKRASQRRVSPILKTCCCGCTLGQGTVGAGVLSAVESSLSILLGALFLAYIDENLYRNERKKIEILSIGLITQGSVVFVCSICLFFAVKMKRRELLLPWLVIKGLILALNIIAPIVFLIMGYRVRAMGGTVVWTFLAIYLYVVVVSYYQSDMGRFFTQGIILVPPPKPTGLMPVQYYGGPPPTGQPTDLSSYPCPAPVAPFYPPQQGVLTNGAHLYPPMSAPPMQMQMQNPINHGDQPPPYSPFNETHDARQPTPKRF